MHRSFVRLGAVTALSFLAGCASKPVAIVQAPPPPVVAPVAAPMPKGAYVGMAIPDRLTDGRYATPNRDLTAAATIWHMRVALNVAALACRGAEGDRIVTAYNALLAHAKAPLALAETRYAAEYRAADAADWRANYDNAMTRLYNFFSQSPAREAFCDAAAATLTDVAFVDDAALPGFAAGRLAVLERPFTDFYRAYDAWRSARMQPIYALSGTAPTAPPVAGAPATPAPVAAPVATAPSSVAPQRVRLQLDPSVFADTGVVH